MLNRMFLMTTMCIVAMTLAACSTTRSVPTLMGAPPEPTPTASNESPVLPWTSDETAIAPTVDLRSTTHAGVVGSVTSAFVFDQFNYELFRDGRSGYAAMASGVVRGGQMTLTWSAYAPKEAGQNVWIVYAASGENNEVVYFDNGRGLLANVGPDDVQVEAARVAEREREMAEASHQARMTTVELLAATNRDNIADLTTELQQQAARLNALEDRTGSVEDTVRELLQGAGATDDQINEIIDRIEALEGGRPDTPGGPNAAQN